MVVAYGTAHAKLIEIRDTQTWSDFDEGGFGAGDTLQILARGNLTITERSGITEGRHLIIEEGGMFTAHARLDTDSRGKITMNGGEFYSHVDFKFPDSSGDQEVEIWLHGGLMVCSEIEAYADRGATLYIGGGVLRTGETRSNGRDPEDHARWAIHLIPRYQTIVIADIGDDWKEVSAMSPSTQITVSFATEASLVCERSRRFQIPVRLPTASSEQVFVDYKIHGGTAQGGGVDYTLEEGTLRFYPELEPIDYIEVFLVDDGLTEDEETIVLILTNPKNAGLAEPSQYTLCILSAEDCHCLTDQVVINEFLASNNTWTDPQEAHETPDWIELYNTTTAAVHLGGMYLTDDLDKPEKWQIPPGVHIEPAGTILFWADDDDEQGDHHTNFKLNANGEQIALFAVDGLTLIDSIDYTQEKQLPDISFGRVPDGCLNWRYLYAASPEQPNSRGFSGAVADTRFSHDRGFYDEPFDLVITCATPLATIRYTTDGSRPTETRGWVYQEPVRIHKTTCIRAAAFRPDWVATNVDTRTYLFTSDPARQALPVLSLASTDLRDREGPLSVELINSDPNLGPGFQIDCESERHSATAYRLKFKAEYGTASLDYPFFEAAPLYAESAPTRFERLVLRRSSNKPVTYIAEPWTRLTQLAMSGPGHGGHSMYIHFYLNGVYQGLINPVERPDAWFAASYFGGEFSDYFAVNHHELSWRGDHYLSGDPNFYEMLLDMARDRQLEEPANYALFSRLCDVIQFADYTILYWYSGFGDGVDNNYYAFMEQDPWAENMGIGLKYYIWDAEFCFTATGGPPGSTVPRVPDYYFDMDVPISWIWQALYENPDFRMLFADRVYKHFYHGGALTDEAAQARWDILFDTVVAGGAEPALPRPGFSFKDFRDVFIRALRRWNGPYPLYPGLEPPAVNPPGGRVPSECQVALISPHAIYYTTDGTDPRQAVTGDPVGIEYHGPIILDESICLKIRAFDGQWSALREVTFSVGPVAEIIQFNDI